MTLVAMRNALDARQLTKALTTMEDENIVCADEYKQWTRCVRRNDNTDCNSLFNYLFECIVSSK